MSSLDRYIYDLEDFELLALYKFRFETFLKSSQNKIISEIENRNLNLEEIDNYIENAKGTDAEINNSDCCPRCFSRKFYLANEIDWIHSRFYSHKITNRFKTCLICSYSQDEKVYKKSKKSLWSNRIINKILSRLLGNKQEGKSREKSE